MTRRLRGFAGVDSLVAVIATLVTIVTVTVRAVPTPSATLSPLPAPIVNYYSAVGARASGLDTALVRAVIATESAGDPRAVSRARAVGMMQLEPSTAQDCGIRNRYDPAENVMCGSRTLALLVRRYGLADGIARYNCGAGTAAGVGGHLSRMPVETQRYVATVITAYDVLQHVDLPIQSPTPAPRLRTANRPSRRGFGRATPTQLPYFLTLLFSPKPKGSKL